MTRKTLSRTGSHGSYGIEVLMTNYDKTTKINNKITTKITTYTSSFYSGSYDTLLSSRQLHIRVPVVQLNHYAIPSGVLSMKFSTWATSLCG